MGFRIDRGIFQRFDEASKVFVNKFKIDTDGNLKQVDEEGNPVADYLKSGDKASDSNTLDGLDSGAFIRSNTDDNVSGHTEWQDSKEIRLGNSADFRMRFDGSHTYFRNYNHGNGNIYFQGEDTAGSNHALLYMFTANTRPYVSLYEDGNERFKTTSAGVEVLGDAYINQGRIHIKRGTGLTHTEWEDDSSANGRAQLILDSHYSDLIIASRNANSNKHGSTLTFATQSTSTNDVAKWVIGQGQYQEGANHLAFAYGVNQTNPHSILNTDNANADFVIMDGGKVIIGGTVDKNAYSSTSRTRLLFGGGNDEDNYFIGTNMEDYGGNYTKLDLRWHTGIRMGAQAQYGGIRFFDSEDLGSRLMSIGETDNNVRIDNNLWIGGAGGWITDLLNGKLGTGAKAADSDLLDGINSSSFLRKDTDQTITNTGVEISFYSADDGGTATGDKATLEVYQDTAGADAFMQFHVGGDYAAYFGLAGDWNDFFVGGWSMGAVRYRVWHAGNFNPASYLTTTGKAADANLLDGINSSQFLRSDTNDTMSGDLELTGTVTSNAMTVNGAQITFANGVMRFSL